MHNKRNDRLAEGRDRRAGTVTVLRMVWDRALLIEGCHGL